MLGGAGQAAHGDVATPGQSRQDLKYPSDDLGEFGKQSGGYRL